MKLVSATFFLLLVTAGAACAQVAPTPVPSSPAGSGVAAGSNITVTGSNPQTISVSNSPTFTGNVTAPGFVGSGAAVTAQVPYAGAVTRNLPSYFADSFHDADFGAVCNGTNDDTAALQAGINAAAGKARFYIDPTSSQCIISSTLTIPSNSQIILNGTIYLKGSSDISMLQITGANNVLIGGNGTLNGNSANQTCTNCAGIGTATSNYVYITGITIENVVNWPINANAGANIFISYVTALNNGSALECAAAVTNCWMDHMYVSGTVSDEGISLYGGVTNSGVTNSFLTGNAQGIGVLSDGAQPAPNSHILIANNIVTNCLNSTGGFGIYLLNAAAGTSGSGTSFDYLVANNITYNNAGGGILVSAYTTSTLTNVTVTGNQSHNDGTYQGTGAYNTGLLIGGNANNALKYISVNANTFYDEGSGGTNGSGVAIVAGTSYSNVYITNNTIYDDQTTKSMSWGVTGAAGVANILQGNSFGPSFIIAADNFTPMSDTLEQVYSNGIYSINQPFNSSANISTSKGSCPGNGTSIGTACYYSGTGVPSFSAPSGSEYLRYDGTTGARVYYNTSAASTSGTSWTALSGV